MPLNALMILFVVIPAVELALLIDVGRIIGVSATLFCILLTGILGGLLARWQGVSILLRIQNDLHEGILPADEILDGLLVFIGGILLLTPGFLTDLAGLSLLVPASRRWGKRFLQKEIQRRWLGPQPPGNSSSRRSPGAASSAWREAEDAEFREDNDETAS